MSLRRMISARPPLTPIVKTTPAIDDRLFKSVANFTYDWESWHAADGKLLWVNPAVKRITGFTVQECLAMEDYPLPLVAPGDRRRIARVMAGAAEGSRGDNVEFCSIDRGQGYRWMSLAWQPMSDGENPGLGFRTSVRDVTERRQLRDQLERNADELERIIEQRTSQLQKLEQRQRQMEKQAALGQLAAGIAHEINNPLAGMRNAFELFRSGISVDNDNFELLELIDREIERISSITHQMFQLYRKEPRRPVEFSLVQAIDETIQLLDGAARAKNVSLIRTRASNDVVRLLPEGEVRQILLNLARNAIQASPAGESVTLSVIERQDEAVVEVIDRGAGVPDEIAAHIFEPFFTTKQGSKSSGMGLGLSVSLSLIEAMNGRIDFESQAGRGTTFTAAFPVYAGTLELPEAEADAPLPGQQGPRMSFRVFS